VAPKNLIIELFTAMKKLTVLILSFLITISSGFAVETCSRIANINYQEVLVDTSSNNRGEGLRYYLQKDQVAKELLDEYQQNNKSNWKSAAMSTLGTSMVLGGLIVSKQGPAHDFMFYGGIGMMALSYIISKTNQHNNEYLLSKSVEEYNKRNTPRIFFSPTGNKNNLGLGMGLSQEF
jgi:hypothetical protein